MAPILFSLYFGAVVDDRRGKCSAPHLGWIFGISMAVK